MLRGLLLAPERSRALVNDQSLATGETARIRVGNTNLLVRCLAIGNRSVRVQIVDSGEVRELRLKPGVP